MVECGFAPGHLLSRDQVPVYVDAQAGRVLYPSVGTETLDHVIEIHRIDHHRPGDPGYGFPPQNFVAGSSVGQVFGLLAEMGVRDRNGAGCNRLGWDFIEGRWIYGLSVYREPDPSSGDDGGGGWGVALPHELAVVVAADHCLGAAYQGRCPGVDPDALGRWRAESRAAFQRRPVEDVMADVEDARKTLRAHVRGGIADLRGRDVPELPEAAVREGIPFLSSVRDRDGREKVILQAATPELIGRFLAGELVPGLVDCYGDPARGFAGGYLTTVTT